MQRAEHGPLHCLHFWTGEGFLHCQYKEVSVYNSGARQDSFHLKVAPRGPGGIGEMQRRIFKLLHWERCEKGGCVLALTLFAMFFIMMKAKKDLHEEGVCIRFCTDRSVSDQLLARTKTLEEAILDLLFADDFALLARTDSRHQLCSGSQKKKL